MRLARIQLRDFRAFPGEYDFKLPNGCSLLIHGENGSGKSSLALALREFISLDRPLPRPIDPYVHAFPPPPGSTRQPEVMLTFDSGDVLRWQSGQLHPLDLGDGNAVPITTPAQRQALVGISRQSGFFDYRALLKTSFRTGDNKLPRQLFTLFVENLLAGFPLIPGGNESVRERWIKLEKITPVNRWPRRMREANQVADPLNTALAGFLDRARVEANRLLATYFPNHRLVILALVHPGCRFEIEDKLLIGHSILPEIQYNGRLVTNHEEFLNEARLTALGLCMFLAALKLVDSNPADANALRLLLLDDVLIGLDIANRMPLLELLRVEFPHHQVILLTHDELWFGMAREHTQHWGNWQAAHLSAEITGPADPPIPRIKASEDDLVIAQKHLDKGELRPAALDVRSAFEAKLRKTCEDNHIKVEFKRDIKQISAQTLWDAVLGRHQEMVAVGNEFLDSNLIPGLNAVRSQVLNRLLHDGGVGLTRPDVQAAIDSITALRRSNIPHKP